jgi:excisionase family DNA binding protein
MSIHSTGLGDDEQLVVSPRRAAVLLDSGVTYVYELMSAGELESYREGRHRKITVRSIRARIERKLAEPEPETSPMAKATAASLRRRGHSDEAAA